MKEAKKMHLCGFLIAGPVVHSHAIWRNPRHATNFLGLDHYTHIARVLERGRFDFLFFADRLAIADRFADSHEVGIRHGDQDATRMDPLPILGALAAVTHHIGLGATRSTTYDSPYNLAREFATLDHISAGRAAWNVVTSMNDGEALNFGKVSHLGHDERYDRADEFMEVTFKLWDSWEPDALVLDRARGLYADPAKVHYVHHDGAYFKSRGPLNIPAMPQRHPVIIQAGSSGRGKTFAARWSEVIFALQPNLDRMRVFAADVRAALADQGRPENASKILMSVMPFIGETRAEAEAKRDLHDSLVDPAGRPVDAGRACQCRFFGPAARRRRGGPAILGKPGQSRGLEKHCSRRADHHRRCGPYLRARRDVSAARRYADRHCGRIGSDRCFGRGRRIRDFAGLPARHVRGFRRPCRAAAARARSAAA